MVVLYLVVFSLHNPPPNRLSSCPLNRRLPWKTIEENSPPVVDDDFDAIGNNIAPRLLLLLLLKKAVLLLHRRRDEQKVLALPIILPLNRINTATLLCILSETHSFSLFWAIREKTREKKREKSVLPKIRVGHPKYKRSDFSSSKTVCRCVQNFKLLRRGLKSGVIYRASRCLKRKKVRFRIFIVVVLYITSSNN